MTAVVSAPPYVPSPLERELMAEIRAQVHRLTVATHAVLDVVASRAERRVAPTYPPLLSELRGAIRPSGSGRNSGGATTAPLPFDAAALELLRDIEGQIAEMYRTGLDIEPLGTSEQLLLEWFREFEFEHRAGNLNSAQLANYRDRIRTWRWRIEDFFAPPKQQELSLCPSCGYTHEIATIDGGHVKRRCVVLTSWGDHSRRDPVAECRHCGAQWRGFPQLRELQQAIDENIQHYGDLEETTAPPTEHNTAALAADEETETA